jgi:epsin
MKNMVKNYSEAEVKVREATSNDPWGPSSTLMSEISDLTYNIVALGEVMRMIWKRLNDHGKNWRHVYKSLVLLDYLIKNGNEKVAQQCKEHIVAIQTLKDFQYMDEQKDQGAVVRDKAKQLVGLLRDDERLKMERQKAFRARERYAQNAMGISSDNKLIFGTSNPNGRAAGFTGASSKTDGGNYADPYGGANSLSPDIEAVRPSDANEEDLQVKLALMLSQQEHEEEVQKKRADEAKLQIALEQSKSEGQPNIGLVELADLATGNAGDSDSDDFFPPIAKSGMGSVDPWGASTSPQQQQNKPSNGLASLDPWASATTTAAANQAWVILGFLFNFFFQLNLNKV